MLYFAFFSTAKDVTVKKIEGIIKRQFSLEMRHKEKEVELIDEVSIILLCLASFYVQVQSIHFGCKNC